LVNYRHAYAYEWKLPIYAVSEDRLTIERHKPDLAFSLNISGDFSSSRAYNSLRIHYESRSYMEVGFDTIVNLFIKLLCEKGYDFTAQRYRIFCQKLVLDYCYVALDFEKELERIENLDGPLHEITLEDGTVLELGKECIIATEVLFNPGLVGLDQDNIISLIQYACPHLLDSFPLFLSGGFAPALKGLGERIQLELEGINTDFIEKPIKIIKSNLREDAMHYSRFRASREVSH